MPAGVVVDNPSRLLSIRINIFALTILSLITVLDRGWGGTKSRVNKHYAEHVKICHLFMRSSFTVARPASLKFSHFTKPLRVLQGGKNSVYPEMIVMA